LGTVNTLAEDVETPETLAQDFHDLLKARAMQIQSVNPIQIVLPMTYTENVRRKQKRKKASTRKLQDPATRAWNFHTALYYKAGGAPWRLVRDEADLTCCFVGVSFYKTLDGSTIFTSSAQVFNERGRGLIVRGSPAKITKDDRNIHMTGDGAYKLITDALTAYRGEHRTMPARVVVHKTSPFDEEEIDGFIKGIEERNVEFYDLVNISRSYTRLFRVGLYPPLRGTAIIVDEDRALLYSRGGIEFFQTYPGMYVPRPIDVLAVDSDRSVSAITKEVLALTKMNWNNTQFDNSMPITLQAARKVGRILKYVGPNDRANSLYSFYM
jgi:argonaute-like protein implicated in RNA metabolism and viral defense